MDSGKVANYQDGHFSSNGGEVLPSLAKMECARPRKALIVFTTPVIKCCEW
jgi:hypothetical protein